jgi:hypothetical protein
MLTNAGRDMIAGAIGDSSGSRPAPAEYIGLTANSTTPSASSTSLTGEITTSGGGLIRAKALYAHTNGQATYTLTKTFTANSNDVPNLPVTIAKLGVFNAASSGTLVYESLLSATATLSASGDAVAITETVTLA